MKKLYAIDMELVINEVVGVVENVMRCKEEQKGLHVLARFCLSRSTVARLDIERTKIQTLINIGAIKEVEVEKLMNDIERLIKIALNDHRSFENSLFLNINKPGE